MSFPEFTLSRAHALVERITRDDHEIAEPLFELLRGIVDPSGDKQRFAIGDEVMKQVALMTPEFEEWHRARVAA